MLRRDGRFWHEGIEVTHPGLHRAFLRGVRWSADEDTFIVQLGRYRGWLDVEDTAFWVTAYDQPSGEIELSDQSRERLCVETLTVDPDEALRCTIKGRFPARFTRAAQAHLLDSLDLRAEAEPGAVYVRVGRERVRAPGLEVGS